MSSAAALLPRVRHALRLAGFHLADEDDPVPGLRVITTSEGVVIVWTVSDGFTALATERTRGSSDATKAVVRAAIAGLLVQIGHTVAASADGEGLVVSA